MYFEYGCELTFQAGKCVFLNRFCRIVVSILAGAVADVSMSVAVVRCGARSSVLSPSAAWAAWELRTHSPAFLNALTQLPLYLVE